MKILAYIYITDEEDNELGKFDVGNGIHSVDKATRLYEAVKIISS